MPFEILSIGGYKDTERHTVGADIWIQSARSRLKNVWYELGQPSVEYERYHRPFLWLADLSKHFVDFLDNHDRVTLHDFKSDFFSWMDTLHGQDYAFNQWLAEYQGTDFRRAIAAYPDFLWNQARDVDCDGFEKHPLSVQANPKYLSYVTAHIGTEKLTNVTPYVYDCFESTSWGRFMVPRRPSPGVLDPRNGRGRDLRHYRSDARTDKGITPVKDCGPTTTFISSRNTASHKHTALASAHVGVGDVVGVLKDRETAWKGKAEVWFAYVQALNVSKSGDTALDVIWLYAPNDTTCSDGRYPFTNELFFSDNCNCGDAQLKLADVICRVSVAFFSGPEDSKAEYFIRQKYTHEETFVTLKRSDLRCFHKSQSKTSRMEEMMETFKKGDAVLILKRNRLETAEIVAFGQSSLSKNIQVRHFLRAQDFDSKARPNELVYTDDVISIPASTVDRRCHVRFYTTEDLREGRIPPPYNRDGTADAYYITRRQSQSHYQMLEPLQRPFPSSLIQGFDPSESPVKKVMNGMDLFCGGGNFGRGLEEGGAVLNKWAVDWDNAAMHTYSANLSRITHLYNGSVNDYLAQAMKGSSAEGIAKVGEVDFISAGSPCQGFSLANLTRDSEKALKYCSMVASVAAFIDFYRPKYALLENVTSMAPKGAQDNKENVFSLMLCCLVGMGYQVQQFHLDAWSFGSAQSRSRLFISIAAPGLQLPSHPVLSHSHLPRTTQRSIGKGANGLGFGFRQFCTTPFEYVTAAEATSDLPYLGDNRPGVCIPYPDHRTSRIESTHNRILVSHIPRFPFGETFMTAYRRGRMSAPQVEKYPLGNSVRGNAKARAWGRLRPDGLFPTIVTAIHPQDGRTGTTLHWNEHRLLTVMEARRAQGFPDDEVLIGSPATQWKIIGNSVARPVALALGMALRTAWLANGSDEGDEDHLEQKAPSHLTGTTMRAPAKAKLYIDLTTS